MKNKRKSNQIHTIDVVDIFELFMATKSMVCHRCATFELSLSSEMINI